MLALLGLNKIWPKILLYGGIALLVSAAIFAVFSQGKKAANVEHIKDALTSLQRAAKQRAEVEAMRSSDARKALKQRWSQRS